MIKLQSVLCPVDFSDYSRTALRLALGVAGRDKSRLTVVTIMDTLAAHASGSVYNYEMDRIARLREFVANESEGIAAWAPPVELRQTFGSPAEKILEFAGEVNADLIVMGTQGLTGYQKLLYGSTTARVLQSAAVPVLAVPLAAAHRVELHPEAPAFKPGRIVAALELSNGSVREAATAMAIAATFGAPLVLLHVVPIRHDEPRGEEEHKRVAAARERLSRLAEQIGKGRPAETQVLWGDPADRISAFAQEQDAGLIVMGLVGAGGLLGVSPGSNAYKVLSMAPTVVLGVPSNIAVREGRFVAGA
jgi:nucleotide-binding universal stress UspA family protein